MTYPALDLAKPVWTGTGTALAQDIRNNLQVFRDYLVAANGVLPGFDMSKAGGTAGQPAQVFLKRGTEWIKIDLTWGTTGGSAGAVTKAAYYYSSDSGGAYAGMTDSAGKYVLTLTYDTDGYCTATTWGSTP